MDGLLFKFVCILWSTRRPLPRSIISEKKNLKMPKGYWETVNRKTNKSRQIGHEFVNKILHRTWDLRKYELLEYDYLGEWYQIDADQFELFNWKLSTISRDIKIRHWQQTHDDNSIPFGEMNLVPYENNLFCLKKKAWASLPNQYLPTVKCYLSVKFNDDIFTPDMPHSLSL